MRAFTVFVRRNVVEEAAVDVEAKDPKDAEAKAMEQVEEGGIDGWEYVADVEEWIERVIASEEP